MIYGKYSRDAHRATSSNRGQSQWMRERASGPIEPLADGTRFPFRINWRGLFS